jgi:hypothetical protein
MKPAMVVILLLVVLLSLIFSSCDLGTEPQTTPVSYSFDTYFPLQPGSTWLYSYYDSLGNPKRDHEANPVHDFMGVLGPPQQIGGQNFYEMTSDSLVVQYSGAFAINMYLNFSSPPPVAHETDPVILAAGPDLLHLNSLAIYSNPPVVFDPPIYTQDSTIITFNHTQPFTSYQDYIIHANANLVWGWGGGYDPFGQPQLGWAEEINTTLDHSFRTTEESFVPQVSPFTFCVANGRIYRFYPQATGFDLQNSDSCRIILEEPLTVGHNWVAETDASWGGYMLHPPVVNGEILSVGDLTIGSRAYSQVVEAGYMFEGDSVAFAHCWFAPGVGIVKYATYNFQALLDSNNP